MKLKRFFAPAAISLAAMIAYTPAMAKDGDQSVNIIENGSSSPVVVNKAVNEGDEGTGLAESFLLGGPFRIGIGHARTTSSNPFAASDCGSSFVDSENWLGLYARNKAWTGAAGIHHPKLVDYINKVFDISYKIANGTITLERNVDPYAEATSIFHRAVFQHEVILDKHDKITGYALKKGEKGEYLYNPGINKQEANRAHCGGVTIKRALYRHLISLKEIKAQGKANEGVAKIRTRSAEKIEGIRQRGQATTKEIEKRGDIAAGIFAGMCTAPEGGELSEEMIAWCKCKGDTSFDYFFVDKTANSSATTIPQSANCEAHNDMK